MHDEKLWREEGPKALLEFLSSATGEDYDAVVYDTKLQFDNSDMEAIRYIASVAMSKASQSKEVFDEPMPENGTVCPYDVMPSNESMSISYKSRLKKEESSEFYLPDSSAYSNAVVHALERRNILSADMTDDERRKLEENAKKARRSDRRYMFLHYYIPVVFAILTLIFIIYKLSH